MQASNSRLRIVVSQGISSSRSITEVEMAVEVEEVEVDKDKMINRRIIRGVVANEVEVVEEEVAAAEEVEEEVEVAEEVVSIVAAEVDAEEEEATAVADPAKLIRTKNGIRTHQWTMTYSTLQMAN